MIHREGWSAGDEPMPFEFDCFGCNARAESYDEAETFCDECLANQRSIDDAVELWAKEVAA